MLSAPFHYHRGAQPSHRTEIFRGHLKTMPDEPICCSEYFARPPDGAVPPRNPSHPHSSVLKTWQEVPSTPPFSVFEVETREHDSLPENVLESDPSFLPGLAPDSFDEALALNHAAMPDLLLSPRFYRAHSLRPEYPGRLEMLKEDCPVLLINQVRNRLSTESQPEPQRHSTCLRYFPVELQCSILSAIIPGYQIVCQKKPTPFSADQPDVPYCLTDCPMLARQASSPANSCSVSLKPKLSQLLCQNVRNSWIAHLKCCSLMQYHFYPALSSLYP
mmetsp:Transcript_13506/g.23028  ORF Transcript_13506/g.23028 Transcript_13506/m.23028 type:complete len:275 (+) Transcript_13506:488-1312(+)